MSRQLQDKQDEEHWERKKWTVTENYITKEVRFEVQTLRFW